jgi:hypothetical protein
LTFRIFIPSAKSAPANACPALSLATRFDDILAYGKPHDENKWWFDLEDVDGVITVPKYRAKTKGNISTVSTIRLEG